MANAPVKYITVTDLDGNSSRHKLVRRRGIDGYEVRYTASCSGCCDLGECCGNEHLFPFDSKAGCRVGSGCEECGYTGKRRNVDWIPLDCGAFSRHWAKLWKRLERLREFHRRRRAA